MLKYIDGGVCAAQGFRAAGIHGGVKTHAAWKKDVALIVSDVDCAAAAMFTTNKFCAAPVILDREILKNGKARAIVINSGNANAATGTQGIEDAKRVETEAEKLLGLGEDEVFVCSTGVIGQTLNIAAIRAGMPAAECLVSEGSDVEIKRCGSAGLFVRCVAGRRLRSASFGVGSVGETSARAALTRRSVAAGCGKV